MSLPPLPPRALVDRRCVAAELVEAGHVVGLAFRLVRQAEPLSGLCLLGCGVGSGLAKPLAMANLVGQRVDGVDYMVSRRYLRDCGLSASCRQAVFVGRGRACRLRRRPCRLIWLPATSGGGTCSIPRFRGRPEGIASPRRYGSGTGCAACRLLRSWSTFPR